MMEQVIHIDVHGVYPASIVCPYCGKRVSVRLQSGLQLDRCMRNSVGCGRAFVVNVPYMVDLTVIVKKVEGEQEEKS